METGQFDAIMGALSDIKTEQAVTNQRLDTIEKRVDRSDEKRDTQVTKLHERLNDIERAQNKTAGEVEAAKAEISRQTGKLDRVAEEQSSTNAEVEAHVKDPNRHSGETPNGGTGRTLGIAGGTAGGAIILVEVVKQLLGLGG